MKDKLVIEEPTIKFILWAPRQPSSLDISASFSSTVRITTDHVDASIPVEVRKGSAVWFFYVTLFFV